MDKEKLEQILIDILNKDYSNTTFTSQLYDMFGKHTDAIDEYIKPDREFWYHDYGKRKYRKLKITYVRTGVMFFVFEDEPEVEHAWFIGSFNCTSLFAAQIYPYEIGRLLSKYYEGADNDFPRICEHCQWNDCNGRIKVEVIWDKELWK